MPRLKLIHQDFNIFSDFYFQAQTYSNIKVTMLDIRRTDVHGGRDELRKFCIPIFFNTFFFNDNVNQMVEISLGFVPEYPLSNIIIGIRQCLCIFFIQINIVMSINLWCNGLVINE